MEQTIEDRRCENVVTEDRAPLRNDLIRGDEKAAALVAASHELEEEVRCTLLEREITELIDHEQLRLREPRQLVVEGAFGRGVYVLLSNSAAPAIRELYADSFEVKDVLAARSINSKADSRGAIVELVIR